MLNKSFSKSDVGYHVWMNHNDLKQFNGSGR